MRNAYSAHRRINESFHYNKLQCGHKIRLIFEMELEMVRNDGGKVEIENNQLIHLFEPHSFIV